MCSSDLFGIGALGIAVAHWPPLAMLGFAATGVANAIYAVRNRTALMRRASKEEQGSIMSTRYSIAQAAQIVGLGVGALVGAVASPRGAFALVGVGMLALAGAVILGRRRRRRDVGAVGQAP